MTLSHYQWPHSIRTALQTKSHVYRERYPALVTIRGLYCTVHSRGQLPVQSVSMILTTIIHQHKIPRQCHHQVYCVFNAFQGITHIGEVKWCSKSLLNNADVVKKTEVIIKWLNKCATTRAHCHHSDCECMLFFVFYQTCASCSNTFSLFKLLVQQHTCRYITLWIYYSSKIIRMLQMEGYILEVNYTYLQTTWGTHAPL